MLRNKKSQLKERNMDRFCVLKSGKEELRASKDEGAGVVKQVVVENSGLCWFVGLGKGQELDY